MSRGMSCWVVIVAAALSAVAGCADSTGTGAAGGPQDPKPSRDVGDQVDAVMKDFKNE